MEKNVIGQMSSSFSPPRPPPLYHHNDGDGDGDDDDDDDDNGDDIYALVVEGGVMVSMSAFLAFHQC